MNNDKTFYLQGSEDEMEFMPIIPLNEDEDANADQQQIPAELPLLPLRNTVLFPGVVIPITVGRDKSIKAVTDAYKADKLVGVVAQKDSNIEEPAVTDLESIGTVAKIVKLIKMPDGGTTIIIQGRKRFKIERIVAEEPYFKAAILVLDEEKISGDVDFEAMVSSIKDLASQIVNLSPNLPSEAAIILKNIENPAFLIHFVSSNISSEIAQKQQLLNTNSLKARAELLLNLMQTELQYAELKNKLTNKTRAELDKQQRDYFLQQQLKAIKDELGGENAAE
ncbi:MAG TPA: LON peptidase substrate-binding domain-containing protein, partial [Ferruginibacter sp.]|nr:LON peptidase substrate-binding domain-containing protein [Ferruginibacter sp.]